MNERIKELWEQASIRYAVYETLKPQDERKIIPDIFAELIVRECADIGQRYADGNYEVPNQILEHFGVEE